MYDKAEHKAAFMGECMPNKSVIWPEAKKPSCGPWVPHVEEPLHVKNHYWCLRREIDCEMLRHVSLS